MSERWKYGNYEFMINPNSYDGKFDIIGDEVRTLSGALISQPTAIIETYDIQSIFYQPRTSIKSVINIPSGSLVSYIGINICIVNKSNDTIQIYNKNMVYQSSISLLSCSNKNYVGFDIQSDFIWICSNVDSTNEIYYKLNLDGTLSASFNIQKTILCSGIRVFQGYLWSLRTSGNIDKFRITDFVKTVTIQLPFGLYYSGIFSDNMFLIVGNNDNPKPKLYHIDPINGGIINISSCEGIDEISAFLLYDKGLLLLNENLKRMQLLNINTVEADLYKLNKEIETKRFVNLVDDMGINMRVSVVSMNLDRVMGYEYMYQVSMTVQKVDRG
jgi:hypothetical protein